MLSHLSQIENYSHLPLVFDSFFFHLYFYSLEFLPINIGNIAKIYINEI